MFTGIVQECGFSEVIRRGVSLFELEISCSFARSLQVGESIAVNGVCLTVTANSQDSFCADVSPQTFRCTSLSGLCTGSRVNLERAMLCNGRFGGHIVSGHVDGTARVLGIQKERNAVNVSFTAPKELGRYIMHKGSVAIDGISLTIARVIQNRDGCIFEAAVIPHTWKNTVLCTRSPGDEVNVECDVVAKYIEHFLCQEKAESSQQSDACVQQAVCAQEEFLSEGFKGFMSDYHSFH